MPTILGIDPGYTEAGIAISVDGTPLTWEVLKFPKKISRAEKRYILDRRLQELGTAVDLVVFEKLWGAPGVSFTTAIVDFAYRHKIPVVSLNPRTWKANLLGSAEAPKSASVQYARTWTGDPNLKNHNCADGICISICAHKHPELLKKPE